MDRMTEVNSRMPMVVVSLKMISSMASFVSSLQITVSSQAGRFFFM